MEKQIKELINKLHIARPQFKWYAEFGFIYSPTSQDYWFCSLCRVGATDSFRKVHMPTIESAQHYFIKQLEAML